MDKMSFMWKTTIRNLFRYKKNCNDKFLGVAGCTALLVAVWELMTVLILFLNCV